MLHCTEVIARKITLHGTMILRLWRLEYPKYCVADLGFKALRLRFGENLAIELIGVLNVGLVSLSIDPCTDRGAHL